MVNYEFVFINKDVNSKYLYFKIEGSSILNFHIDILSMLMKKNSIKFLVKNETYNILKKLVTSYNKSKTSYVNFTKLVHNLNLVKN
jgi:hypothetical protein